MVGYSGLRPARESRFCCGIRVTSDHGNPGNELEHCFGLTQML